MTQNFSERSVDGLSEHLVGKPTMVGHCVYYRARLAGGVLKHCINFAGTGVIPSFTGIASG
jgi:hypothetical protein